MTIQEAVTKATEGGYHIHAADGMDSDYVGANSEYSVWTRKDNASSFIVPVAETFLDPHFWLALGCVLGWEQAVRTVHVVENGRPTIVTRAGQHGSPTGTTSLITLPKGNPLKPSLTRSPSLRPGTARSRQASHADPRVAGNEETPSVADHNEGKRIHTCRRACSI